MKSRIIALLTDLGTKDYFVAAMKGAILSINPDAKIVDITHEVPKYDAPRAAFTLLQAAKTFPGDSIFAVVVDPGVGTKRKIVLLKARNGMLFIGPDNGVLTLVSERFGIEGIWRVSNRRLMRPTISPTFHGRDIMAAVAAHLSLEVEPKTVGPRLKKIKLIFLPRPRSVKGELIGQIVSVDDFGNLVTNIDSKSISNLSRIGADLVVKIAGKEIPMRFVTTFGEVGQSMNLCYVGSSDMLELAKNMGNLAEELKVKIGAEVRVKRMV